MHDPGLKVHTPGEPARTDRTHEATFTAGQRPCPDPDEIDRWVRDHQVRQVEDERRRVCDDRYLAADEGGQDSLDRTRQWPSRRPVED
jgi:hypothetical protein